MLVNTQSGEVEQRLADVKAVATRRQMAAYLESEVRRLSKHRAFRRRFEAVAVDRVGNLVLTNHKQTLFTLEMPGLELRPHATAKGDFQWARFEHWKHAEAKGCDLKRARFADGSEAVLDSRGLLHLHSANARIPQCTIVLAIGPTAGWCSDGRMWGPAYYLGERRANRRRSDRQGCDSPLSESTAMKIELASAPPDAPQRPAAAWFLPGDSFERWLASLAQLPLDAWASAPAHRAAIAHRPHARRPLVIASSTGGKPSSDSAPRAKHAAASATLAPVHAYGRIGQRLYVPVEAVLTSPAGESEIAALLADDQLYIWHPTAGLTPFAESEFLAAVDLLQRPAERPADWSRSVPGVAINDRLLSLTATQVPTIAQLMEMVPSGDIGQQVDQLFQLHHRAKASLACLRRWQPHGRRGHQHRAEGYEFLQPGAGRSRRRQSTVWPTGKNVLRLSARAGSDLGDRDGGDRQFEALPPSRAL